jgi:hypothetical protein
MHYGFNRCVPCPWWGHGYPIDGCHYGDGAHFSILKIFIFLFSFLSCIHTRFFSWRHFPNKESWHGKSIPWLSLPSALHFPPYCVDMMHIHIIIACSSETRRGKLPPAAIVGSLWCVREHGVNRSVTSAHATLCSHKRTVNDNTQVPTLNPFCVHNSRCRQWAWHIKLRTWLSTVNTCIQDFRVNTVGYSELYNMGICGQSSW